MGFGSPEEMSLYSKVMFLLLGKYILIENRDSTVFSNVNLWLSNSESYLAHTIGLKLGALVESGIYNFQNHYLILKSQKSALEKFFESNEIHCNFSLFTLAVQLLSTQNSLGEQSNLRYLKDLSSDENTEAPNDYSAKFRDFKIVWILYLSCVVLCYIYFVLTLLLCYIGCTDVHD